MNTGIIHSLQGCFLVASSHLNRSRFEHSVIYICSHDPKGAMGVTINQPSKEVTFDDIADSLGIEEMVTMKRNAPLIFNGGPVESNRGFIVHDMKYSIKTTVPVTPTVALSATSDIVNDIALGGGPANMNFCLGYAGWAAGQLEEEIAKDSWLIVPEDEEILFKTPFKDRYDACTAKLGLNAHNFMTWGGQA